MTSEARQRLVIDKERLLSEFRRLRTALEEYRAFLAQTNGSAQWQEQVVPVLREQNLALLEQHVSPGSAELAVALLRRVLRRVHVEQLRFEPRAEAPGEADTAPVAVVPPTSVDALVASLHAATETAPLELQEKLNRVLVGILEMFSALAVDDAGRTEAAMASLNLVTSNLESQSLLREIAIVTRDVYTALQSVSDDLPLEALSDSSRGLSDAVQRLNSVVVRLDQAATQNLDGLEKANQIVDDGRSDLAGIIAALRAAQNRLMGIKAEHPALETALAAIQERLSDAVGGPAMTLHHTYEQAVDHHMALISNQSFQELTTRTLHRIIAFVESLELQLYDLLKQYRPNMADAATLGPRPLEDEAGPDAPAELRTQSQGEVDKLLGELGF